VCCKGFRSRIRVWVWIAEPIWASGHEPHEQAGHMIAVDPPSDYSFFLSHPRGRPHMHHGGRRSWFSLKGMAMFGSGQRIRLARGGLLAPQVDPCTTLTQH
jgi:hypothetical protein